MAHVQQVDAVASAYPDYDKDKGMIQRARHTFGFQRGYGNGAPRRRPSVQQV